jgi:hypothetical protein
MLGIVHYCSNARWGIKNQANRKKCRVWIVSAWIETQTPECSNTTWEQNIQSGVRQRQLISNNLLDGSNHQLEIKTRLAIIGTKLSAWIGKRMEC